MAMITSVGSGLWSAAGTWDTGVPADGDDVVIAPGHVVTFDVDQSAFTTGVKITINGTLTHAVTGGPYTLFIKTGAGVIGSGTWTVGTLANPIPFAVKHTITGAAGWYVDGVSGLTMTVFGAEPSVKTIKLSDAEAAGQTELSVDTDITADIWADGDIIKIDNINNARNSEERVIAAGGRAASTLTVTSGLTGAKIPGSLVHLVTRNIKIVAVGTGAYTIYRVTNLIVGGGMWYGVTKTMFYSCSNMLISGGAVVNTSTIIDVTSNATITGGVFSNSNEGLYRYHGGKVAGGTFSGNGTVLNSSNEPIITGGAFSGNGTVLSSCLVPKINGGEFTGNQYFLYSGEVSASDVTINALRSAYGRLFNVQFTGTEHFQYNLMAVYYDNCQSDNHAGVDDALKTWGRGGIVASQNTTVPAGYSQAYLHALESDIYPCFWRKHFGVPAGSSLSIEVQLRKSASMTYLPRVYLMESIGNPLIGGIPIDSFIMTDSTDTWETDTFAIDNSAGTSDKEYVLWFAAQNATGVAYSAVKVTSSGGGGGISRARIIGGV